MRYQPTKAEAIVTDWTRTPTGLALAWSDRLPAKLVLNLHKVTDDLEWASEIKIIQIISHYEV